MEAVATLDDLDSAVDAEYASLFAELTRLCQALGAGGSAEDIAQEVLLEGRAKLGQLRDRASLRPWLRTIAVRRVSKLHAKAWRSFVDEPAFLPVDADLGLDAATAIAHLPDRERIACVLVYGLGYRQEEAAEMLGITRGGLASSLWQARQKLARDLAPYRRNVEP
jgi:DNA-directed RNA polymerase specialized sigma24 family protein